MKYIFLLLLLFVLFSGTAAAAFAAPAAAATATTEAATFPTRATVEAQLGRKLKFFERVVYGVAKRKAKRQARRAERGERRTGPVSALSIITFALGVVGLAFLFTSASVVSLILGLGALITGVISLVQFGGKDEYKRGRGLAIAGLAAVPGTIILIVLLLAAAFAAS